jgi:hypothetical protein
VALVMDDAGLGAAVVRDPATGWQDIARPDTPLLLEARDVPILASILAAERARAPFVLRAEGSLAAVEAGLAALPAALRADIMALARRFADLMGVDSLRVRWEGVTGHACWKWHADYTDVRLITTYAGAGTDYLPAGMAEPRDDADIAQVPTGWIGLFKGRAYDNAHPPCFHRSPPVAGPQDHRLLLVIDTPLPAITPSG